jgi:hypothetical protein
MLMGNGVSSIRIDLEGGTGVTLIRRDDGTQPDCASKLAVRLTSH